MTSHNDNPDRPDPHFDDAQLEPTSEMLAGYVLGDLSSDELSQMQQYLASNAQAREQVAELQATLNLLPLSLPEVGTPPATLGAKLLQSAASTPQQASSAVSGADLPALDPTAPRRSLPRPLRSRAWRPSTWGAIAAATAVAFFGWQNLQLRHTLQLAQQELQVAQQRSQQLEQVQAQLASSQADVAEYQEMLTMLQLPENRLLALSGASGFTEASSGSVVISPLRNWAILTLKDLPAPPPGKAYQLWAMANGEKVYCVEFKPDAAGQVVVEIPVSNWAGTPMVSVTLEDEGTVPTQTSEMLMNGSVI